MNKKIIKMENGTIILVLTGDKINVLKYIFIAKTF